MEPAFEVADEPARGLERSEEERRMFEKGYSITSPMVSMDSPVISMNLPVMDEEEMRSRQSSFGHGRSLPPLRVAIARRESYYEP